MTKRVFSTLFFILILVTFSASQTVIKPPENKFKVEDDLKIGKETSEKIEGQYPLLKDEEVIKYIQGIGLKLSRAIPPYLTNNKFQFVFKVLDVSDENAWALPGGRIYLHRGLLTIVRNESELAGIIAHEMSHVILRHTTAKMTQIENPVNKLIINILVLEGLLKGKPLEGIALAVGFSLSYDREYEMQADILASKILARAGYDPRHFANFILYLEERKGKKETWTWLSTHPASSERYHQINKEAKTFALSAKSARNTSAFSGFKKKLSLLPRTFSIAEFDKRRENKKINEGIYGRVGLPSSKTKSYVEGRIFKVDIPENWEVVKEDLEEVWISTKGAYGKDGITHGVIIGTSTTKTTNLEIETEALAKRFLGESQPKLERVPNVKIGSRDGFSAFTVRNSRITKQREVVSFYATFLNSKSLLYVILIIPQEELGDYNFTFLNILNSITLEAGK